MLKTDYWDYQYKTYETNRLKAFCKEENLDYDYTCSILNGRRSYTHILKKALEVFAYMLFRKID